MNNRTDRSRCCTARTTPLVWHRYRDADGAGVVDDEMGRAFPSALPDAVRIARYADLVTLLESAAAGELDPDDRSFDPVARDPELWELRWTFEDDSAWRMYHAEPPEVPGYLVALAFHEKDLRGSSAEIRAKQNDWIDVASQRCTGGRQWLWGIP